MNKKKLAFYKGKLDLCKKQDAILKEVQDILFKMRDLVENALSTINSQMKRNSVPTHS